MYLNIRINNKQVIMINTQTLNVKTVKSFSVYITGSFEDTILTRLL